MFGSSQCGPPAGQCSVYGADKSANAPVCHRVGHSFGTPSDTRCCRCCYCSVAAVYAITRRRLGQAYCYCCARSEAVCIGRALSARQKDNGAQRRARCQPTSALCVGTPMRLLSHCLKSIVQGGWPSPGPGFRKFHFTPARPALSCFR